MRRFLRYTRTIAIDVKFFCWKYHSWEFWKNQRDRHGGEVYGGGNTRQPAYTRNHFNWWSIDGNQCAYMTE